MYLRLFLSISFFFLVVGWGRAEEEKAIVLLNASAVDAPLLERVRAFVEEQLYVSIRAIETPKLAEQKDVNALEEAAKQDKPDSDVLRIVLASFQNNSNHLVVCSESGVAVVNVKSLYTDNPEKFARRVERQIMRAAAFCFELPPTFDPFCVTRDYQTLDELDSMGRNYSPPWQGRFAKIAAERGLHQSPIKSFKDLKFETIIGHKKGKNPKKNQ